MSVAPLARLTTLISSGATPLGGAANYSSSGEVMLLRSQNVLMGRLSLDDVVFVGREAANKMSRTYLSRGDVLLNITGASIGRVATFELDVTANVNQHVCVIRPRPEVLDYRYLRSFLASPVMQRHIDGNQHGGTRQALTFAQIGAFEIPLPPLAEQRRIADILDKADAIRRKRKVAIALTEELLRSAFLEMFGDPVTNPKGWPVKSLGDVIASLDAGWSANGDARLRTDDEYGVLKVSAVTSGVFRSEEHKAVPSRAIDRELVTPRRGDLLFSRANTRELVAATCLVERDEPRLFLPDKLWRVVPRTNVATAPYLRFLLAHDRLRYELTKTATGTSGSMLNVSMDKLRGLRAPVPPIEPQKKFASLVWKSLDAKAKQEVAQCANEDLFKSLVARAFSGGLSA